MSDASGSTAYDQALAYLQGRLDYERTPAVAYGERTYKLERMAELLARLGNPERSLKIVHIAGTKGKGSTAAMVGSMLTAAGYRVGVFSSPHLFRVEERMAIDGQPCSAAELVELVRAVRPHVEELEAEAARARTQLSPHETDLPATHAPVATCFDGGPTYFEITTAMALMHFARRAADAAVLEVGLGGRLDSTNVCLPLVAVITSISYDHTRELGPTLTHIAGEKAGIIKPGVPVVSGATHPEARSVIRDRSAAEGSPLCELETDFQFVYRPPQHLEQGTGPAEIDFTGPHGRRLPRLALNLVGRHQGANAAVAVATIDHLREAGFVVSEAAIRRGLASATCPARVQVLARRPTVILDAAHNVASSEALIATLDESFAARRRWLIFATTRDKDVRGMLEVLLPRFDEVLLTRYVSNPRGVPIEELEAAARAALPACAGRVSTHATPAAALASLRGRVAPEDLVCVAGSFFLAADLHAELARDPL